MDSMKCLSQIQTSSFLFELHLTFQTLSDDAFTIFFVSFSDASDLPDISMYLTPLKKYGNHFCTNLW